MHTEALAWVERHATTDPVTVLDVGGRNVNGSPRGYFPNAKWTVLDILDDPGVDIVANAALWDPTDRWDVVVCCETLEHTRAWRNILNTCWRALVPGGLLIVTTAAPGRPIHSGVDGGPILHAGEQYNNIDPAELRACLVFAGFYAIEIDVQTGGASEDVRAVARKPIIPRS